MLLTFEYIDISYKIYFLVMDFILLINNHGLINYKSMKYLQRLIYPYIVLNIDNDESNEAELSIKIMCSN